MEGSSEEEEEEENREKFKSVAVTSQELFPAEKQQESRSHSSSHQRTNSDVLARRLQQWMDRFYFFFLYSMLRSDRFFSPVVQTTLIFFPCALFARKNSMKTTLVNKVYNAWRGPDPFPFVTLSSFSILDPSLLQSRYPLVVVS